MFWEHENAIASIEELALYHRQRGDFAKAKNLYVCLLAMIKKRHGAESERLALNFYRLGEVYSDEGNYQAAQIYYNRAASIWEKTHPNSEKDPFWFRNALTEMQEQSEAEDNLTQDDRQAGAA